MAAYIRKRECLICGAPAGVDVCLTRRHVVLMACEAHAQAVIKVADELELRLKGRWRYRWREDDSPKGENVPGVRYLQLCLNF